MSKHSLLVCGWVMAAALLATPTVAMAEIKVGVLDWGRLMEESPQGKTLLETLKTEAAAKQRELQAQVQGLQAKQEKFNKDRATMTPDQISRADKELRDGQRNLAQRQQEIQDDFNARRNEEMSKLQRTLFEEVRNYAKAQNFDLVLTEGVIYATAPLDVTAGVLQVLQSRVPRPAAAATPAAPAAPAPRPQGR